MLEVVSANPTCTADQVTPTVTTGKRGLPSSYTRRGPCTSPDSLASDGSRCGKRASGYRKRR